MDEATGEHDLTTKKPKQEVVVVKSDRPVDPGEEPETSNVGKKLHGSGMPAEEAKEDEDMVDGLWASMSISEVYSDIANDDYEECRTNKELEVSTAADDLTGKVLDWDEVVKARLEEVEFLKRKGIFAEVPYDECMQKTGRKPTSVRWVDINKGTEETPIYRSRLVARDFKGNDDSREDLFATTPPLEAKKMLFAMAASQKDQAGAPLKLMFIDVKKAHLYAKCTQEAYVELPAEYGVQGKCGKLVFWPYGMRPAARGWEDDYKDRMIDIGFAEGRAAPTDMVNESTEVRLVVHGDDFTFLGPEVELHKIAEEMKTWYELKVRGVLGPDETDIKTS